MEIVINGDLVMQYTEAVSSVFVAFLPLIGAVTGMFLCFAIAERVRFLIQRMSKKS